MQNHWKSIAVAAAAAALGARAGRVRPSSARACSDTVQFAGARTQRQISTYLLYRSFSTDERNTRRFVWWREAQGRRDTEPSTQPES
jgi:hypothetical protein